MVEKGGFDRREKVIVRIELVGWAYDGDLGRIGFYGYGVVYLDVFLIGEMLVGWLFGVKDLFRLSSREISYRGFFCDYF